MVRNQRYHLVTLGCPKNEVDSEKLAGTFIEEGMIPTDCLEDADLVVVNTCAFVEEARQESIDTILGLAEGRRDGAHLVVTGCMAERYGNELVEALPEVDQVIGFGVPVKVGKASERGRGLPVMDLLNLPRPASTRPWAYVKIAEGCDRACGYCAIPSFRGLQRSRSQDAILAEIKDLNVREVVLVSQDLASYGRDQGVGKKTIVPLINSVTRYVDRVRVLYLYPSEISNDLIEAICATGVPYFDLSLQHVSRPLLRRMRRWGDGERFQNLLERIRHNEAKAIFRSNFIVGYPGETEEDHDELLSFISGAQLDWCGFFPFSEEVGTYASTLGDTVPSSLVTERLCELSEIQDAITASKRDKLIGKQIEVLVDEPGIGRTFREAPEIDGVVLVPEKLQVGDFATVSVTGALGPDLETI